MVDGPAIMDPLARLADALRERGFSLRYSIRVTAFERLDSPLIDTVSNLAGMRGQEAEAALLGAAVLVDGLEAEFVEDAAALLREHDATVAIELSDAQLFAYLPDDPARGDQALRRLSVVGLAYEVDVGRLGDWLPPLPTPCANLDELLAAIDRVRETWANEGMHEADREQTVLDRVSARELALEAPLRASEGAERREAAAIYGDWLQARGDPRGMVAAAATMLAEAAAAGERQAAATAKRELDRLCAAHPSHLFGAGRPLLFSRRNPRMLETDGPRERRRPTAELTWTGPVIASLTLADTLDDASAAQLAALLAAPACACLRTLVLSRPFADEPQLGTVLESAPCASSLRELSFVSVGSRGVQLRGDAFERLERLVVFGDGCRLGPARLPALRELVLESSSTEPHSVALEAPTLASLVVNLSMFAFPTDEFPIRDHLIELVHASAFAHLRRLSLGVDFMVSADAFIGLAELLETCPASATLELIDLRETKIPEQRRADFERLAKRMTVLLPE